MSEAPRTTEEEESSRIEAEPESSRRVESLVIESEGGPFPTAMLVLLAALHAGVDGLCVAGVLWASAKAGGATIAAFGMVTVYNLLAFAGQAFWGLVVDEIRSPRGATVAGCGLVALSWAAFPGWPWAGVAAAGVGNALFHLGAGTLCLGMRPGLAWPVGIFVAPGAFGVLGGVLLARSGGYPGWAAPALLLSLALPVARFSGLAGLSDRRPEKGPGPLTTLGGIGRGWTGGDPLENPAALFGVGVLLAAVAIRSFVGSHLDFPWKKDLALLVLLTLCVVGGKACGGWLADRFGWARLSGAALVGAALLLGTGQTVVWAGLLGIFLFNLVMPVTLAAVVALLPGNPAFGFGLTCLALNLGMMPLPEGLAAWERSPWFFGGASVAAGLLILAGLSLLERTRREASSDDAVRSPGFGAMTESSAGAAL